MSIQTPFKDHPHSFRKKFLPFALYALLPIALVRLCFFPLPSITSDHHGYPPRKNPILVSQSPPPPKVSIKEERKNNGCDYSNGKWVHDPKGPLYNSTACGTIKDGQNCELHGRPDKSYLYWRWQPRKCQLPRFDPTQFLHLISNRHVAFVGDSIARNQLESLLCLLATAALPTLVHTSGPDHRFRKWHFGSHNATLSVYWSPFLVNGVEKSERDPYNRLYLDSVSDVWAKDLPRIDVVILSVGHWFLHPAVFHRRGAVVGCHYCGGNHTEVGFYDAYATAINTTLRAIADRRRREVGLDVVVTTFSPSHFEGEWDSPGACSKTRPEERDLEGMDYEMWRRVAEEVAAGGGSNGFRVEALDVSRLAVVRPDGHPGPYMNPFPFANGVGERVQNDCVHWCLPGPIDTWNEIMLQIMKRWNG